ncbi:hypothetical protein Patl1_23397 [Pistacia atlantica]|uniref:Uncharacterized protein n=1 Tax=Pistacia atlantica TaxID=434234 RepID=A0ACC0ZYL3_9ROSI|nr:hypothetical protein Patl1_23397 [Pistacia atlantica]
MSGYGYNYRGYSGYNGLGPQTDTWSKPNSYASDHVCKPVIVDAEGRKHPVVYNPDHNTGSCITKTETVVQQVHSPFSSDHKHSSPTKFEYEPLKEYGYGENQWHKPTTDYGYGENKWHKPSTGYGYGDDKWHKPSSPVHDRPHTKLQTEASGPRFSPLSASHWRQTPTNGNHGNTGYGDYQNENYDGYHRKNGIGTEPTMITSGGWARPSHTGWASPPDTSLSKPTNDIGAAMEYLTVVAKPTTFTTSPDSTTSQYSRVSVPISSSPTRPLF